MTIPDASEYRVLVWSHLAALISASIYDADADATTVNETVNEFEAMLNSVTFTT